MRRVVSTAMVMASVMAMVVGAAAACAAPSQSGLALCFPSVGSTVLYPATMELAVNTGGVQVAHVSVYDGNTKSTDLDFLPSKLIDFALKNGHHSVTVNLWDVHGKLYQAKSSFTITGFGAGSCAPQSAAVTVCTPGAGSYQPESQVPLSLGFGSGVKSWSVTLDGQSVINSAQYGRAGDTALQTGSFAAAGSHTLTVTTVDSKGVSSKATRQFNTFYDGACSPTSGACRPGIELNHPADVSEETAGDAGTKFQVQAEVTGNPKPTTKMIVYFDGTKVQENSGPGITTTVTSTKGSHFLVIQAWDTTGRMYEKYGNIDLQ